MRPLREIELNLAASDDLSTACRGAGNSDAAHCRWRKRFGGKGRPRLSELKRLEKANARLERMVAELALIGLILRESLNHLEPGA